jgi:Major Facilitator Superfamily
VGSLAGGAVLLAAFAAIELRSSSPMLDLRLFRIPAFAGASIASFAVAASVFSMLLYIVLYLQNVLGHSPLEAGLRLLPVTAMAFVFSPLAARLSERVPLRALIGVGLALAGVGLLVARGLDADSEWTALLYGLLLMGAGIGLVNPTVSEAAIGVVPAAKAATGAAINNTFRQVGVAVGIAAFGAVFQGRVESKLGDLLASGPPALHGQAGELAPAVSSGNAEAAIAAAPPEAQAFLADAAREAFLSGLNEIFLIAGVTALIGAALSLVLIRARDLHLDAHEESAISPEPAVADEETALAA